MGTLKVNNVGHDVRDAMIAAWKAPTGAAFNKGAIRSMTATSGVDPRLERFFSTVNLSYSMKLHDDVRTVDVDLTVQKKHP